MQLQVVIPTFNRASCLDLAIQSALAQTHPDFRVLVVDDGSTDETRQVVARHFDDPRFAYLRLARNVGTAKAKNAGLVLGEWDAITFHDSDDQADPQKLLLQHRALEIEITADPMLDWPTLDFPTGETRTVDAALGAHRFIKLDGSVHVISKRVSLVDDFFPNLQTPSKTEGDWVLINSGLFRRRCFQRLGGYLDSVEEDRELRNRLIASGHLVHFIEQPLLTKIEMPSSLTTDADTGYRGTRRSADRAEVWRRARLYRSGAWGGRAVEETLTPIDLADLEIAELHSHQPLPLASDLPLTAATREHLRKILDQPSASPSQPARLPRRKRLRPAI